MSSPKNEKKVAPARSFGWMAEFDDEHKLLEACRKVRDSGYTRTDAFAPFPVHGIDEALGIKPTVLPWIVLCMGLTGMSCALLMEWWMNAVSYPYIISGKPFFSLPAFIPVMFECTILFSAFTTFFSMILLNGLPRFSNPVFTNPKFDRSTDDRFFLWVDSRDKYFNSDKVKSLLESTSPLSVEVVKEDDTPNVIPSVVWRTLVAVILFSLIPGSIVLRMRAARSESPRWHVFFDMDFQPKKKAQQTSTLFADNRASRPPVAGTIARGDLTETDPYYLGFTPENVALISAPAQTRMVSLQSDDKGAAKPDEGKAPEPKKEDKAAAEKKSDEKKSDEKPAETKKPEDKPAAEKPAEKPAEKKAEEKKPEEKKAEDKKPAAPTDGGQPPAEPEPAWITKFPFDSADQAMMDLGKLKYETYCAACHGYAGNGDGLVSQRALQLAQGYWVQPTSLHEPRVQQQPVGKVFHTITNGRGKMGSYGAVMSAKERWAVVLYVEALQRSRDAKLDDVPEAQRAKLTGK